MISQKQQQMADNRASFILQKEYGAYKKNEHIFVHL